MNLPAFVWMILVPLLAAPVVYLAGRLFRSPRLPGWLACLALLLAGLPFVQSARQFAAGQRPDYALGSIVLSLDGLGLLLACTALVLSALAALFSGPYLAREAGQEKYHALSLLMTGVILGLGCATDLFNLWVWFEAMALSSYFLVGFHRDQPAALEAGYKYLVQSAAGSALVVIGIALVYAATGTLDLAGGMTAAGGRQPLLLAGTAFLVTGFGVKAALVPFHTWLPDAHAQAPSGISALLSGVVIEAGLVALLRVLGALTQVHAAWLLAGFGAVNMLVGNLMALRQVKVKRLLAYSSLAHVGYMLLGFAITFLGAGPGGAQGGLFHLLTHGLMKALAFLSAGALLYCLVLARGGHDPLQVDDLAGAARRYPLAVFTFSLAVLGLGGLPPLAGFMSKWQIFVAGFETADLGIELLVIFAALNSVLSLAYYAPLVNVMYRLRPSERVERGASLPHSMVLPLAVLGILVVVLGVWPGLADWLTVPAALAILAGSGG